MTASSHSPGVLDESGRDEVELLVEEFLSRRRNGEKPTVEEYTARRPELADEIRAVFSTFLIVEDLGKHTGSLDPGFSRLAALDAPGHSQPGAPAPGLQQLGEYRILREIGRGGMGIVYEAEQESLGRRVALKVLPFHSLLGARHLERFQQEARAAARLSHPNIVPVFGVGEHLGLRYFVMQYIPGHGLDAVIEEVARLRRDGADLTASSIASSLSTGGRQRYHHNVARIVRDAAVALDHAHREGILHRDVKPSNLLLDPTGHVWLADFGLAKSEGSDDLTRSGDFVGTLRYMAPERFKGWSDPRSDVYSLGLTLYELLALRPAFLESDRGRLLRQVESEQPPSLRRLDRSLPRDLETVVLKAIAKEPVLRYESAHAMAQDLDRFLHGKPVEARRSRALGRLARWCARNRTVAALLGIVLALLVAVAAVSMRSALESSRSASDLKQERDLGREKLRVAYSTQARILRLSGRPGQRFGAIDALIEAARIRGGGDLADEAAAAMAVPDVRLVKSAANSVDQIAWFDEDARRVGLVMDGGVVTVHSTEDGREIARLPGPGYTVPFTDMRFHPDGKHLAVRYFSANAFDRWTIWDLHRKEVVARANNGAATSAIDFDPRDGSALIALRGGILRTVEIPSGQTLAEQQFPADVGRVAVHPGGELLAVQTGRSLTCQLFDRNGKRVLRAVHHPQEPTRFSWDPRGRFLAVACRDFLVYLWDAESGALRWSREGHQAEVYWTAFHPDGDLLLTGGWDNKLLAWDTWSGRSLFTLPRQYAFFSRDGRSLATSSKLGYDLLEVAPASPAFTVHGHEDANVKQPASVSLSPAGRLAASSGNDGVRLWDLHARREVAHLPVDNVLSVEFDAAGDHFYTSGDRGLLRWPIRVRSAGVKERVVVGPPVRLGIHDDLWRHASGDGGKRVAVIHRRSHAHIVPLEDPAASTRLEDLRPLEHIAFSADGRWVAATSLALNRVAVWEAASGKRAKTVDNLYGFLTFDPQGRFLVAGGRLEYVFFDIATWEVVHRIPRSPGLGYPGPTAFDPRGRLMAIAATDSRIWLLEVEGWKRIAELEAADPRTVNSLSLDLEAGYLAASSRSQRCHFWDLRSLERQLAAIGLPWDLHFPGDAPARGPLEVDALVDGAVPGLPPEPDSLRSPPLFRAARRGLFRPGLETYGDIDAALAAPRLLVGEGASWKYFRGLVEPSPGLEWTAVEFDDAAWPRGESGIGGHPASDVETRTSLQDQVGSFATVYLRHVFELEDAGAISKLLLSIRFEDAFVAYLNGREVARRNAGEPGERLSHEARALKRLDAPRQDFVSAIDAPVLVAGKNVLAIQGLAHRRNAAVFVLPALAAVLAPGEAQDANLTRAIAAGPDGAPDLALSAYRSGRILERAGKLEEAVREFEQVMTLDPASPEPVARATECHRARGEPAAAERFARRALERGGLVDDGAIWAAWSLSIFGQLRRPLPEALSSWPGAEAAASRHGAELRSTVEDLVQRGAVRINCGGLRHEPGDGAAWSADRFHLGGMAWNGLAGSEEPRAAEPEESSPRRSLRLFRGDRQIRPAYRVPVPPGRYTVSLQFLELSTLPRTRRVFAVMLEGKVVLEGYEPPQPAAPKPEVKSFRIEVGDGFLDLDFLAEHGHPLVNAIEITL